MEAAVLLGETSPMKGLAALALLSLAYEDKEKGIVDSALVLYSKHVLLAKTLAPQHLVVSCH